MSFTDDEIAYMQSQPLARLATLSADGEQPDVVPVGLEFDGTFFWVGVVGPSGLSTRKFRNVLAGNQKVALVIDDLVSFDPFIARCVRIYGRADPPVERVGMVRACTYASPRPSPGVGTWQVSPQATRGTSRGEPSIGFRPAPRHNTGLRSRLVAHSGSLAGTGGRSAPQFLSPCVAARSGLKIGAVARDVDEPWSLEAVPSWARGAAFGSFIVASSTRIGFRLVLLRLPRATLCCCRLEGCLRCWRMCRIPTRSSSGVATLDIGKANVVCCVRVPSPTTPGVRAQEVATYNTMTRSLLALADRLAELEVTRVVMESTSDYWEPVFLRV